MMDLAVPDGYSVFTDAGFIEFSGFYRIRTFKGIKSGNFRSG